MSVRLPLRVGIHNLDPLALNDGPALRPVRRGRPKFGFPRFVIHPRQDGGGHHIIEKLKLIEALAVNRDRKKAQGKRVKAAPAEDDMGTIWRP